MNIAKKIKEKQKKCKGMKNFVVGVQAEDNLAGYHELKAHIDDLDLLIDCLEKAYNKHQENFVRGNISNIKTMVLALKELLAKLGDGK